MAEFKVTIEAIWQKDGAFEDIGDGHLLEKQDDDESEEDENMEWSFATSFFKFFFLNDKLYWCINEGHKSLYKWLMFTYGHPMYIVLSLHKKKEKRNKMLLHFRRWLKCTRQNYTVSFQATNHLSMLR